MALKRRRDFKGTFITFGGGATHKPGFCDVAEPFDPNVLTRDATQDVETTSCQFQRQTKKNAGRHGDARIFRRVRMPLNKRPTDVWCLIEIKLLAAN